MRQLPAPQPLLPSDPGRKALASLRSLDLEQIGHLAALSSIAETLNSSLDLDQVLSEVLDLLIATLGAQRGFVMMHRGPGQEPRVARARGLDPEALDGEELRYSRTVAHQVLSSGEPLLTHDAMGDDRLSASQSLRLLHARSIMCVPMQSRGGILGLIYLDSLMASGIFTGTHLALMRIIAGHAASAIERAGYFEALVEETERLRQAQLDTIERLAVAAEHRDEETGLHLRRVGGYCEVLARALGLPDPEVELLRVACPMHDVGKIGIPDRILFKPGKLDDHEWVTMKQHTLIGARILSGSSSELLRAGAVIARSHHERWDGTGYPDGLAGRQIPLWARIMAVADVFDALTSQRPYKRALPNAEALEIMREGRGTHFEPAILDLFFDHLDEVLAVQARFRDWSPMNRTTAVA